MQASRKLLSPRSSGAAVTAPTHVPMPRTLAEAEVVPGLRVALVHDWLVTLGGADRVLLALHQLFPSAPIFVGLHDPARLPEEFRHLEVRPTWLQRLPGSAAHHRQLVPLMPFAFQFIDLRGFEVVLSSSHACAKGVRVPRDALHVCYCHTPMRYAWDLASNYRDVLPSWARPAAQVAQSWLRWWDRATVRRVHHFVANSRFVAERIWRCYHRHATVIYPPVDLDFFTPAGHPDEFFLVVSRLVSYKRIDLAVETFNSLGIPLMVVGDGPEAARLRAMARSNVTFLGAVPDTTLREYYRRCRALVFPGEEDFGLVPVETQACGRPVIAFSGGGVRESVLDRQTGTLFPEQTVSALTAAVRGFDAMAFDPAVIRRQAEQFSRPRFHRQMGRFIARVSRFQPRSFE